MIDVTIATVANQALTIQLDGRVYNIELRDIGGGSMAASIARDNVPIVSNTRIVAGTPLLPYQYQEAGNFLMTVEGDAVPYWEQFNVTQFLVYLTSEELAAYRAT